MLSLINWWEYFYLTFVWLICTVNGIIILRRKFYSIFKFWKPKRGFLSFDKNTRFFVIRLVLPNYEIFLAESLKQVFFGRSFGYALFAFLRWFQWIIKAKHVVLQGIVTLPHIRPTRSLNRRRLSLPCLFLKVSNTSAQAALWGLIPLLHRLFCRWKKLIPKLNLF